MIIRQHEVFNPPATNISVWRYLDFTKFVSLLETRTLVFARSDLFDDPYEGAWSSAGIKIIRDPLANGGLPVDSAEQLIKHQDLFRKEMFLSCWHMSNHESAAMWKLYLQSNEGVAIRTDYVNLESAVAETPFNAGISKIKYIDYETTPIPFGNVFFPFVYKRLSFSHEHELRVLIWRQESINEPQITQDTKILSVPINLELLISSIHVSPTAPRWFGELVAQIAQRYGITAQVVRSSLYDRPTF